MSTTAQRSNQGQIFRYTWEISPAPENAKVYKPVDPSDPENAKLAQSIRENGVLVALVISRDGFLLSGHRRLCAAKLAGLDRVPVKIHDVSREEEPERFLTLLTEFNRQRDKSLDEILREEVIQAAPGEAYEQLVEYRRKKSRVKGEGLDLGDRKRRPKISRNRKPFLEAVLQIMRELEAKDCLPTSDRALNYRLLNEPPITNLGKRGWRYASDKRSYSALCRLTFQARLEGYIPSWQIADETRSVTVWRTWQNPREFVRGELNDMFRGYWRDLQRSQPNHIEMLVEKNTVAALLEDVAGKYTVPMTSGRGYASYPPMESMAQRFRKSGKDKLILLLVSDFDADGECIAESFARNMRDDFGCPVFARKVALTREQVLKYDLPEGLPVKEKSTKRKAFWAKYGKRQKCYELEALPPDVLKKIVGDEIDAVLDRDAFNHELDQEQADADFLHIVRQRAIAALKDTVDKEDDGR